MAWLSAKKVVEPKQMPDPGCYEYLVQYLLEVGPASISAGNIGPITWQEIESWQRATGVVLEREEMLAIRDCSCVYADQYIRSQKKDCPAPWVGRIDKAEVSKKIGSVLRSIAKRRQKNGLGKTNRISRVKSSQDG